MTIIQKAKKYAIKKHGAQMYDTHPYVYHLDNVFNLLYSIFPEHTNILASAYLHDLIEDSDETKEKLSLLFNINVANLVHDVTGFGHNRREKQQSIIEKIENNEDSINLKLADRIVNMEYSSINNPKLLQMYIKEIPLYESIFSKGHPELYKKFLSFKNSNEEIKKQTIQRSYKGPI